MRHLTLWSEPFSPLRGLVELQRNLDRVFYDEKIHAPHYDVEETETHFMLSFDLPGVPKNDIKIEVTGNELMVSGVRKEARFERRFTLPQGIDSAKVEAQYQDGVLMLAIPKAESAKTRQIPIGGSEEKGNFFSRFVRATEEKKNESQVA